MQKEIVTLTEDEFDEKFILLTNHLDHNASFDGHMFETYGKEVEFVLLMAKQRRVVTILDGDDDNMYYASGMHLVNRIGYLVLASPNQEDFEVKLD